MCLPAGTGLLLRCHAADLSPLLLLQQHQHRCLRKAEMPLCLQQGRLLGETESPLTPERLQHLLPEILAHLLGRRQPLALLLLLALLPLALLRLALLPLSEVVCPPVQGHIRAPVLLTQVRAPLSLAAAKLLAVQLQDCDCLLPALDWKAHALQVLRPLQHPGLQRCLHRCCVL